MNITDERRRELIGYLETPGWVFTEDERQDLIAVLKDDLPWKVMGAFNQPLAAFRHKHEATAWAASIPSKATITGPDYYGCDKHHGEPRRCPKCAVEFVRENL